MATAVVLSAAAAGYAEGLGPINTERPSFSSSPLALAARYWQVEAGYQFTHDDDGATLDEHGLPNLLLRYGLHDRFEVQLSSAGYTWSTLDEDYINGFQDASLGVKWQVNSSDSMVPIGLFAGVSLPLGSSEFSSDHFDPAFSVFWSWSTFLDFFGTATLGQSDGTNTLDNAVGISFSLTDNTGIFLEYLGAFTEGDGPAHELHTGITWLLAENLQVDINGGVGLNTRASDYYLGTGVAYRF
jgi:hypothetical protein